jgi:hypothetical protein
MESSVRVAHFRPTGGVLVQRELESGRSLLAVYSHFDGPVWTTQPNVVAGGRGTLLNLQLVQSESGRLVPISHEPSSRGAKRDWLGKGINHDWISAGCGEQFW